MVVKLIDLSSSLDVKRLVTGGTQGRERYGFASVGPDRVDSGRGCACGSSPNSYCQEANRLSASVGMPAGTSLMLSIGEVVDECIESA
jgi:hypothetical protein